MESAMQYKFNKWIYRFSLLIITFLCRSVDADMPYVQGVDYFPEHYSGYYNKENDNKAISDDDIEKDFFIMSKNFNALRTYKYDPINLQRILRAAKRYDMKVAIGLTVDSKARSKTEEQINGLNQMFEQYPELKSPVVSIIIGNEVIQHSNRYFSKESDFLIKKIRQLANFSWFKNSTIGLSVSESDTTLLSNAGIRFLGQLKNLKLQDKISLLISINPYLDGCSVEAAIGLKRESTCRNKSFANQWQKLVSRKEVNSFRIVIGETGWPTDGPGAKKPVKTKPGNLEDAIKYYEFLYPFLHSQKIRGVSVSVPFFVFSAFDQADKSVFGLKSNFWGVYNSDNTPKTGMIYPIKNRIVKPTPKLGTNIEVHLPRDSPYANLPILLNTQDNIYSNLIPEKSKRKSVVYSFLTNYPFVEYSLIGHLENDAQKSVVSLVLPNTEDNTYKSATCTNKLISGNGYGRKSDMSLKWKYPHSKEEFCQHIRWAEDGVWID